MLDDATLATAYFWLFALLSVGCSGLVLVSRHPIQGVVSLIGVMLSLAGLYALLHSPFLAVIQVLVYAGAIMMLLVFVIMVLNQGRDRKLPRFDAFGVAALILPLLLCGLLLATIRDTSLDENPRAVRGEVAPLAAQMFDVRRTGPGWYLLFEIGGLVLLSAVVGAVLLSKRRLDSVERAVGEGHQGGALAHEKSETVVSAEPVEVLP